MVTGAWDSHNTPTRVLPTRGLAVEYWVNGVDSETAHSGIYTMIATDQVRFTGAEYAAIALAEVPPLVFSEVMRDVDLFVGVASVGNDPNWSDGGPGGTYLHYWQSYAFGDLSATAQTRKLLLETLIPRLKIARRCALADRYLVVQGDLRTYKIH